MEGAEAGVLGTGGLPQAPTGPACSPAAQGARGLPRATGDSGQRYGQVWAAASGHAWPAHAAATCSPLWNGASFHPQSAPHNLPFVPPNLWRLACYCLSVCPPVPGPPITCQAQSPGPCVAGLTEVVECTVGRASAPTTAIEAWGLHPVCAALLADTEDPHRQPLILAWLPRGELLMASRVVSSLSRWVSACPALGPLFGSVAAQGWDGGLEPHRCRPPRGVPGPKPLALRAAGAVLPPPASILLGCFCSSCRPAWLWGWGPHPARPPPSLLGPPPPTQLHVPRPSQPCPSALPGAHTAPPCPAPPHQLSPAPPHSALPCLLSPPLPSPALPFRPPVPHPAQLPSALLLPALPCRPGPLTGSLISTAAPGLDSGVLLLTSGLLRPDDAPPSHHRVLAVGLGQCWPAPIRAAHTCAVWEGGPQGHAVRLA